ncbi:VWA domain-containing protein [Mariniblastus sp.]|nr:VWA domain-containing protein [Mariniblastus sp.]
MKAQPPPLLRQEKEYLGIKKNIWIVAIIALIILSALILGLFLSLGETGNGSAGNNSAEDGTVENVQTENSSVKTPTEQTDSEGSSQGTDSSKVTGAEENSKKQEGKSEAKRDGDPNANTDSGTTPDDSVTPSSKAADIQANTEKSTKPDMTTEEKQKYSVPKGRSDGLVGNSGAGGFFGLKAIGNHIGYVVDISGSMSGGRLDRAKKELRKSISELGNAQKFSVYFFSDGVIFDQKFIDKKPSENNQQKLNTWLNQISTRGGTNPWPAMEKAFAEKCDEIFLLSDGEFNPRDSDLIRTQNKSETRINTVSLSGSSRSLQKIARESGGQYIEP